jgi:GxxExxY protein
LLQAFTTENTEATEVDLNDITDQIIGAAITIHRELGPGLLESTYEACVAYELVERGLRIEQQRVVPVHYRDVHLDCGYRIDLLVEGKVIVELKSVERLEPIHEAQLLTYLKLGWSMENLNASRDVPVLKDGIRRRIL